MASFTFRADVLPLFTQLIGESVPHSVTITDGQEVCEEAGIQFHKFTFCGHTDDNEKVKQIIRVFFLKERDTFRLLDCTLGIFWHNPRTNRKDYEYCFSFYAISDVTGLPAVA